MIKKQKYKKNDTVRIKSSAQKKLIVFKAHKYKYLTTSGKKKERNIPKKRKFCIKCQKNILPLHRNF